jgi:hypothetical protein
MQVTAWSNGSPRSSGAGYGLRIKTADRDRWFERGWENVDVDLGGYSRVTIPLSSSFWAGCPELRSAAIGRWLLGHRLAPWPHSAPPTLSLLHVGGSAFRLSETP